MRTQQVLALCVFACIACGALAYDEYKEYEYKEYHEEKPDCGPDQFPELRNSCIDPHSGWCVGTDYECKINEWAWCKQVSKKWACKYNYKPKDTLCSPKKGSCSQPAYCNGTSPVCPLKVLPKGTICHKWSLENPCIEDSKCDGIVPFCPGKHKKPIGTPCSSEGGYYDEVFYSDGKAYVAGDSYAEGEAKKHGWNKCHRCYKGSCVAFKYEWWKKEHKDHNHKDDGYYNDKSYDGYKAYDDDNQYYESKYDTEKYASLEGYEPEIYCHKGKYY